MRELLIGDVHFGVKTNSTVWLETQLNFFRKFIFKIIKEDNFDRIVFLGDLFDIRYAINQEIGIEVKKVIRELCDLFNKDIIFVAGNHDYYSPLEEFVNYNAYNLVFGDEFVEAYPNIHFIIKDPYYDGEGGLFLPWYWTENPDHFDDLLYQYKFGNEVKAIYCHADLTIWPGGRISSLKGIPVYSGHIHYLYDDELGNLHNLGAALPLNFGDVNQDRYLYILEDFKIVDKITNNYTPSFRRFYNEDIFNITEDDITNSYVQLCVSSSNINKAQYIEQIKYLKNSYTSSNISLRVVDDSENNTTTLITEGFNTNINNYIENNIPEHLTDKYQMLKERLESE
jgi:UDP-2,3-diacylglucosamine pyrophosphatase LpxH